MVGCGWYVRLVTLCALYVWSVLGNTGSCLGSYAHYNAATLTRPGADPDGLGAPNHPTIQPLFMQIIREPAVPTTGDRKNELLPKIPKDLRRKSYMSSSEKDTAISILGRVWLVADPYWPQISSYYHHFVNFHEKDVMTPILRRSPNLLLSLLHTSYSVCSYCIPAPKIRRDLTGWHGLPCE